MHQLDQLRQFSRLSLVAVTVVTLLTPTLLQGETAFRIESCAEIKAQHDALAYCGTSPCTFGYPAALNACLASGLNPTSCQLMYDVRTVNCWDFENGTLNDSYWGNWQTTNAGTAMSSQPTYGDNVSMTRMQPAGLYDQLVAMGGDYWKGPYPMGHQGRYWIGTRDNRPSRSAPWGATRPYSATGWIDSPVFGQKKKFITFLVGGTATATSAGNLSVIVYVNTGTPSAPVWKKARAADGTTLLQVNPSSAQLRRESFDVSHPALTGKQLKVRIIDNAASYGLSVDHILHTDRDYKEPGHSKWGSKRSERWPVWGAAETHAHPVNDVANKSLGIVGTTPATFDGQLMHGTGGQGTGNSALDLPACFHDDETDYVSFLTGWPEHTSGTFTANLVQEMLLERGSLGMDSSHMDLYGRYRHGMFGDDVAADGPGAPGRPATRYMDFEDWPNWWGRLHQQMAPPMIERAYKGGVRLMVVSVGNTELFGWMLGFSNNQHTRFLSDHGAIRRGVNAINRMVANNAAWMGLARTPREARDIIGQNKMAIVIGLELDNLDNWCAVPYDDASAPVYDWGSVISTESPAGSGKLKIWRDSSNGCGFTVDSPAKWAAHLDRLLDIGVRHIIPVHLANNSVGGTALYGGAEGNPFFMNNAFLNRDATHSANAFESSYSYKMDPDAQIAPGWCSGNATCATMLTDVIPNLDPVLKTVVAGIGSITFPSNMQSPMPRPLATATVGAGNRGHTNQQGLVPGEGKTLLQAMKERGMIIDIAHAGKKTKDEILGLSSVAGGYDYSRTSVVASSGCDMDDFGCRDRAYPVIASHAGPAARAWGTFYTKDPGKLANENQWSDAEIGRIRDSGGMVGVGVGPGDSSDYVDFTTITIQQDTVANDCAGSSRTFAQNYLYMISTSMGIGGRSGLAFGTDMNGFNSNANPRYRGDGCHSKGGENQWAMANNPDEDMFKALGWEGTAPGQRWLQMGHERLRYAGEGTGRYAYTADYRDSAGNLLGSVQLVNQTTASPLSKASWPNRRHPDGWDINTMGVAHYGMMPDFFQDLYVVGMQPEQFGPLFSSAEAYIKMWEKACALADSTTNATDAYGTNSPGAASCKNSAYMVEYPGMPD